MKKFRKFLKWAFIILFLAGAGFFAYIWFYPLKQRDIFDFVPADAVFVVEAEDAIEDWKSFSKTKVWRYLLGNELFADIEGSAKYMDTLIHDNQRIFDLVGGKRLVMSAHMTGKKDYDFLYMIDLKKAGKVTMFMDVLMGTMDNFGLKNEKRVMGKQEIWELGEDDDVVFLTFVDNILLSSYNRKILVSALEQYKKPFFSRDGRFVKLRKRTPDKGEFSLYLNYKMLDDYLHVFMDDVKGTPAEDMSKVLQYTTLDLDMGDRYTQLEGYTSPNEQEPSIVSFMKEVKGAKVQAPEILPRNTSFFLSLNFDNFNDFYGKVEEDLKQDEEGWKSYQKSRRLIEKLLKIKFSEHLFSWIGQEITLGMVPVNKSGSKQAYLAIFHANNEKKARENMEHIAKRIKRRTPVKYKKHEYKDFKIFQMELKGFFKLFFGKLFKKFDKPHYAQVYEYVIFSNDTAALHRVIDNYLIGRTLSRESNYENFAERFSDVSNYFIYINTRNIFPWLPTLGDAETARDMKKNEEFITCFRQIGFQMREDDPVYKSQLFLEFVEPKK